MSLFHPPFAMRLVGGLRAPPFNLPLQPIDALLGVKLELKDDLELGGAYYAYAQSPILDAGLSGVLVQSNEVPGTGLTYQSRPDLSVIVYVDWLGNNLLDLGRLEWQLRKAYGDLYDVAEYSVVSSPLTENPLWPREVHWVQFAAAVGHRGIPSTGTPNQACSVEFELAKGDELSVLKAVTELDDSPALIRSADSFPTSDTHLRLTLLFDSPSLLELGRYIQVIESVFGDRVDVLSYRVIGDLLRDGSAVTLERTFTSAQEVLPGWRQV
jgi:hypothetical protein